MLPRAILERGPHFWHPIAQLLLDEIGNHIFFAIDYFLASVITAYKRSGKGPRFDLTYKTNDFVSFGLMPRVFQKKY